MTFDKYPKEFREACATHEFLRKLGFPAKDIYIHLRQDSMLLVVLKERDKMFAFNLGPTKLTQAQLEDLWPALVQKINDGTVPKEELSFIWRDSFIFANKIAALAAMKAKGFTFPRMDN